MKIKLGLRKVLSVFLLTILSIIGAELFYQTNWVNSLLEFLEDTYLLELLILFFLFSIIVFSPFKNVNLFLKSLEKNCLTILYLNFITFFYQFLSIYNFQKVFGFLDFLDFSFWLFLIFLILTIVSVLVNKFKKIENVKLNHEGFIYEKPLEKIKEDTYQRSPFVKELVNKIQKTDLSAGSFGVGIVGEWGTGKTSFKEMIKWELEKNYNQETIRIDFNPWQSESPEHISEAFFDLLSYELNKQAFSFGRLINAYLSKLSGKENFYTALIRMVTFNRSSEKLYAEINDTLEALGKRIYIFVDDLDRLDGDEILAVFKLIRNTASFRNVVFVVGYDRVYLNDQLGNKKINLDKYLKKIFNNEVSLPSVDKFELIRELKLLINNHLKDDSLSKLFDSEFFKSNIKLTLYFQSRRDVNLFLNSLILTLPLLKSAEINLQDILLLEILKLLYPSVHYRLYYERFELLTVNRDEYTLNSNSLNSEQGLYLKELLGFMFKNKSERNNPIYKVVNFEKYFAYRLLSDNISEAEFREWRLLRYENIFERIDEWVLKNKGEDLFFKLKAIRNSDYLGKVDFLKLLTAKIYTSFKLFNNNKDNRDFYFESIYQSLLTDGGYRNHDIIQIFNQGRDKIQVELELKITQALHYCAARFEIALGIYLFKNYVNKAPSTNDFLILGLKGINNILRRSFYSIIDNDDFEEIEFDYLLEIFNVIKDFKFDDRYKELVDSANTLSLEIKNKILVKRPSGFLKSFVSQWGTEVENNAYELFLFVFENEHNALKKLSTDWNNANSKELLIVRRYVKSRSGIT